MAANHPLTLAFILESGDQVLILEGVAAAVTEAGRLQAFPDAYNPKTRLGRRCHRRGSHRLGGSGRAGLPGAAPGRLRLGRRHARADPLVLH